MINKINAFFAGKAAGLFLLLVLTGSAAMAQKYPGPLSPEESLKKIKIIEGFKAEIFAAEPNIMDPVSLAFDEQGQAYVVEMPDYPFEAEPGKGKGRIKLLKDIDNDGRIDQAVIFAENVTEATSILPWQGGLIVTAAPDILYLKDTNGDGKADTREVLFTGFFQNNSEAQITNLRYGMDNWIYANNHGQDGLVTFNRTPNVKPVAVRGADFRFRLDQNKFELETGPGQFGQAIDEWGHRFINENSIHLEQVIIPWRYTHRHPFLPVTKAMASITDHEEIMLQETPPPYWRAERTKQRNKTFQENNLKRVEYAEDRFSGAAGMVVYAADGFPPEFNGNIFISDVAGNLVHRDVLTPSTKSPVFVASRAGKEKEQEFLTSTDSWFRPTNFTVGPDGYLYVLDYYRQHIETPVSIPDELKADMNFMAGSDKGRVYRILPTNSTFKNNTVNLAKASNTKLLETLSHPNLWWRLQAQRLLLEKQDKSVVPAVKKLFITSKDARTRLHALYVLEGLNALDAELIKKALQDSAPGVRENAIILAEQFPETYSLVQARLNDPVIRVAFQTTLNLPEFKNKETAPSLIKVLEKYGQDFWFRMAVLSSEQGSSPEILQLLRQPNTFFQNPEPWKLAFVSDLSNIIGARNQKDQISTFLNFLSQPDSQITDSFRVEAIKGLTKGLNRATSTDPKLKEIIQRIKTNNTQEVTAAIQDLKKFY
ncbi:PVC-type heme-binding CxxCH protein [Adhaeribacter radiodurans]|uniref:Dehydrogenase n=1 Tax=Adhaeribacter radiodurans TaxID=2745197 RepID=A0A7L7LA24_9BACT|nr:PVC-type heme-binding CxxCH protein [Adhaeribacter radiodurans]QMU29696.1 dehydrogenase [Adhaeribacter radiodurans]